MPDHITYHGVLPFNEKEHNFLDNDSEDTTMKSINILFDEGLIRKITDDTKYDNLIKLAIFCHNKEGLPKNIYLSKNIFPLFYL